jgi:hypothetical protein
MLKYLLLIALCAASCTPAEQKAKPAEQTAKPAEQPTCVRQVSIAHIGIQDKSVTGLVITTDSTLRRTDAIDGVFIHVVVNGNEFTQVADLFKTFDASTHKPWPKGLIGDYGTFEVRIVDACKQISDNAYQPKRADELFRFLLKNSKCFESKNQKKVEQWLNEHLGMY